MPTSSTNAFISSLLLLLLLTDVVVEGCSGGSGGCCRKSPPVVVSCGGQNQCQQGYGCGQYGCARRKAFAGLTRRIDGVLVADEKDGHGHGGRPEEAELSDASRALRAEPVARNISVQRLTNPNFIFRSCCEARGLPDACLRHCHFNTYTATTLEAMFHKVDKCPIEAVNEIHYCAAQGIDHRQCCQKSGVASTSAGAKCLAFCDQRPNRFTPVDASYLPCYDVFETMKQCFFHEIRRRAERKFTPSNGDDDDDDVDE